MPFLVDSGPPVDPATLNQAKTELPREYGLRVITNLGRKTILARVPRAKPDYNYELAMVAFYASLEDVKDAKDVLLVGDDKTVRMEPLRLRDHIREQQREDKDAAPMLRSRVAREYGWTTYQSPLNNHHKALVLRLPVGNMAEAVQETLEKARAAVGGDLVGLLSETQYVYFITDNDYARVGRRVFLDAVCPDLAEAVRVKESHTANPLHLSYQTPGAFIKNADLPRG